MTQDGGGHKHRKSNVSKAAVPRLACTEEHGSRNQNVQCPAQIRSQPLQTEEDKCEEYRELLQSFGQTTSQVDALEARAAKMKYHQGGELAAKQRKEIEGIGQAIVRATAEGRRRLGETGKKDHNPSRGGRTSSGREHIQPSQLGGVLAQDLRSRSTGPMPGSSSASLPDVLVGYLRPRAPWGKGGWWLISPWDNLPPGISHTRIFTLNTDKRNLSSPQQVLILPSP